MIHVFQVFKKCWHIPKEYYNSDVRKDFQDWSTALTSEIGYLDKDILYLPVEKKSKIRLNNVSGLILQDVIGYNSTKAQLQAKQNKNINGLPDWFLNQYFKIISTRNQELTPFSLQKLKLDFEIFSIVRNKSNQFEIHLNYKANHFQIGEPERDDHKLCELKKGYPIKISINGKSDFTMTGRKQRSYSEFEYIIEYSGEAKNVKFIDRNKLQNEKIIPIPPKHIDLRKILY